MAKTYSVKELRALYGVSAGTFTAWLRSIPGLCLKPRQRILSPAQVEKIQQAYGVPE